MIEIPIHDQQGQPIGTLQLDESTLGGAVRPDLLKQAYVRYHANQRQGSAHNRSRSEVAYSTRKLYKQKGTGNARRGSAQTNILRHGARAHAKSAHSWRLGMPDKMRKLANRNALLAKAVDGEIKLVDKLSFEKPSTRQFASLLAALKIDRNCLVALPSTLGHEARSAENIENVTVSRIDRLNAFDMLNHRYLLVEKATLEAWLAQTAVAKRRQKEAV